ncbi:MAG: DUF4124 domain-containing protein [Pseudomonadota bacterium]
MRRLRQLLVLPAIVLALPASAEIYRWTDDTGETHFGANPPAGVDAKPVSTARTNTIENASRQSEDENKEEAAQEEAPSNSQGDGGQNPEDQKEREEIREQNCEAAREALKTLEQNARVQVMEDGERRYLSPEEKEAERERYEKIQDENCD